MLKKRYRLHTVYVKKLLHTKTFFYSKLFLVKYAENNLKINRYAICISNKITKRAILRNSIRRKFYNFIKEYDINCKKKLDKSKIKCYDFLFILTNETKVNKKNIGNYIDKLNSNIKFFFNKFKF